MANKVRALRTLRVWAVKYGQGKQRGQCKLRKNGRGLKDERGNGNVCKGKKERLHGRPKLRWKDKVTNDMCDKGLREQGTKDREE